MKPTVGNAVPSRLSSVPNGRAEHVGKSGMSLHWNLVHLHQLKVLFALSRYLFEEIMEYLDRLGIGKGAST
jgi:hypothetical protein